MIGTEDGYWYSFHEKEKTYSINRFNEEVDYGRADDVEAVLEWFNKFVDRARAENCCRETGADCGVRGDGLPCACSIEARNDVEDGN